MSTIDDPCMQNLKINKEDVLNLTNHDFLRSQVLDQAVWFASSPVSVSDTVTKYEVVSSLAFLFSLRLEMFVYTCERQ